MKKKAKQIKVIAFVILAVIYLNIIRVTNLYNKRPPLPDNIEILEDGTVRIAILESKTP